MKLFALFKMTIREFRRDIFRSILLLALVDLIYANFTGIQLNGESSSILWQGGNDTYMFGLSTVLLKLFRDSALSERHQIFSIF